MLGRRTDVSTMILIVTEYRLWQAEHPEEELRVFLVGFILQRYGAPVRSSETHGWQKKTAMRALAPYSLKLNHDGDFSLLALLGAISEVEGFTVNPGTVMRRVYRRNQDIPSYIFGGYGIPDLESRFRAAALDFGAELATHESAVFGTDGRPTWHHRTGDHLRRFSGHSRGTKRGTRLA